MSGHGNKLTDRGTLTSWRHQRRRPVRIRKETDRLSHTHVLVIVEGGTCQDTERDRPAEPHSLPEPQSEDLVRTWKETDRPSRTHKLETAEGGTCHGRTRKRLSEVHSRPGNGRRMDLSGHGKKPPDRGALTSWGRQRATCQDTEETHRARSFGTHKLKIADGWPGQCDTIRESNKRVIMGTTTLNVGQRPFFS